MKSIDVFERLIVTVAFGVAANGAVIAQELKVRVSAKLILDENGNRSHHDVKLAHVRNNPIVDYLRKSLKA